VKAFKDGKVADEFTGAIPPPQVEAFFDRLVPSQTALAAEEAVRSGDESALREVLAADPKQAAAATALARILLARGESEQALALLEGLPGDFLAAGLTARAELNGELATAFQAWDEGDHARALEELQGALEAAQEPDERDRIRKVMVAIFTELGAEHPLAREYRRRLSSALF
jgi:putative thioredoxin